MYGVEENERIQAHYIKGFSSLVAFIASDRDKSTQIYRRFDYLSARNVLLLQSELAELEARQRELDIADTRATVEEKRSARNWRALKERAADPDNVRERERMEVVEEIQRKIKEYHEAIVLQSTVLSFESPSPRVLKAFRNFPTLGGNSVSLLDNSDDLSTLHSQPDEDMLTRFFRNYLSFLFVTRTSCSLVYISERGIQITVALMNMILAVLLLFGAIYSLYYVRDAQKRLGLIAGYTMAFAICVGLVTNAQTSQVFAACAAYAAVLVVFVSGNIGIAVV